MYLQPNNATKITLACCALHNISRTDSKNSYSPSRFADKVKENGNIRRGGWRDRNDLATIAKKIWDTFHKYFYGRGQVSWQWKHVN